MHIYGKDQQAFHLQRSAAELWWTRVNILVVIVQLACFLAAIIRTGSNANNSMSNSFFITSSLQLKDAYLQHGCQYNITRTHAFFRHVTYAMSPDNVGYFVSRGTMNIRYLMAVTAVHVTVSMLNRLWFETNTHEIRYHFVVFRKDVVTTWEVLLMVLGLVMTFSVTRENELMTDYLIACGTGAGGAFYHSAQPYTELIVSYIVSIGITVINAIFAIWNLSKENPRDAMLKEDQQRREEWQKAMREYYGLPDPSTVANGGGEAGGPPDGQPPHVTYANNQAATTDPNAPTTQAGSDAASGQQQQALRPHHHNYHDTIRNNFRKPFSALSNSLRRRTQSSDPLAAAQRQQHHRSSATPQHGGPPRAEAQQVPASVPSSPQPPQPSPPMQASPHVGPSVSRPLTPLLNGEYDDEEMIQASSGGRSLLAPQDQHSPGRQPPPQPHVSSSHSGRFDLHEVDDDDEPYDSVNIDVTNSSKRGPGSSSVVGNSHHANYNNVGNSGGRRAAANGAAGSESSTALLNARIAAVPPPPPVYSGDRRQRMQNTREQMLAPPSPLLGGGAETTDDTVLQ